MNESGHAVAQYSRPTALSEALDLLGRDRLVILAGGTDYYPALGDRAPAEPILDITGLDELDGIAEEDAHWRIGALCTWSRLIATDLPPAFDALKLAGREVGSVQIQNRATVVGNLCNASPAADGVPALLILGASVELTSGAGTRVLPLTDFITGNRTTLRRPDEIVTAILVPKSSCGGRSAFVKLGSRKYLVISIVMVAARIEANVDGTVGSAAVSVGACSAVARRLTALEQALAGLPHAVTSADIVNETHLDVLTPISDVRSSADYRRHAARECVRRALSQCLEPAP